MHVFSLAFYLCLYETNLSEVSRVLAPTRGLCHKKKEADRGVGGRLS